MNFLITGAGRGIGYELTMFALEGGHNVVALVRDPNNARALTAAKKEHGDLLNILKADVCVAEDLAAAKLVVGEMPIDILINNAGILTDNADDFKKLTHEELTQVFAINTFAPVHVAQTFLGNLLAASNPKLVNMTSLMGSITDNTSGGHYAYRMSKTALNMFAKSFSVDYPQITTLIMHPGWVRTEMGGPQAPLLPREAARSLYKFILESNKEVSGQFYNYKGDALPW